jgi:hypothetical protein
VTEWKPCALLIDFRISRNISTAAKGFFGKSRLRKRSTQGGILRAYIHMAGHRIVNVLEVTPGSILALPVFNDRLKLLGKGTVLNRHLIDRITAAGITEVVVESSGEEPNKHEPPHHEGQRKPIEHCSNCGTRIELQPPAPEFTATAWHCTTCGAIYFGRDAGSFERRGLYRLDPAIENPFARASHPAIPPETVQRLIKPLASTEYQGPDRRREKRYPVTLPVVAVPLAADFRIDGEPAQMLTANISLGGAALIHTRFIDADYLALDFTGAGSESLQVVLKVLRVRSLGLVYEISGEFVSRLVLDPSDTTK